MPLSPPGTRQASTVSSSPAALTSHTPFCGQSLLAHPLPKDGEVGPSRAASVSSHRTKIAHLHGQESSCTHTQGFGLRLGFVFFFFNKSLLKFIYWLCWVFAAGPWLSPAAVEQGLLNRGVPVCCGGSPRCTAHAQYLWLCAQVGKLSRGGTWAWLPRGT